MTPRLSLLVLFASLLSSIAIAQDDAIHRPKLGDAIVIELTGKPAATYLRLCNQPVPDVPDGGFGVPLEARIISIDHDNLIADYQIVTARDTDTPQLVTMTVKFRREDVAAPSDYRTYQEKVDTKEQRLVQATIARHESLPKLRKHSFEGIKIRVWSLSKEITE